MTIPTSPPVPGEHPLENLSNEKIKSRRWYHDALLVTGAVIVSVAIFLAVFGEVIAPYDPRVPVGPPSSPPSGTHWFGTDTAGLDVFSRVISAPRIDVTLAVSAALLSGILGTLIGLLAGFYRGPLSALIMRISDVLQAFPVFILAMVLVALSGRNLTNLIFALTFLYTPIFVRLTRAEVLTQRERSYVEAARAAGNSDIKIALKHVLPNSLTPSLIQLSVTVGFGILLTAGLSFVGAGVRPPNPEWGLMIANSAPQIVLGEWWTSLFPGIAVSLTVVGFAALSNAIERRVSTS
jgi:peptide/nickel transport system permease protein